MRGRLPTLITMFGAAAIVMLTLGPKPAPSLVWNASESVPIGPYRVQPSGKLTVTNLVVVQPLEPLATFLADGGYLPRGACRSSSVSSRSPARPCVVTRSPSWSMALRWERRGSATVAAARFPPGRAAASSREVRSSS
jgi:type IV secretory pathway protease TraF